MKKRPFYVVNAALACCVLYFVLEASRSGRTAIDWTVIGLVVAAILWNLVQLGRRLFGLGGGKALWHLARTLLFWLLGIRNTFFLPPEDVGGWKTWLGWFLLVVALCDTVALFLKEREAMSTTATGPRAE